jgi:hypothetical protein
VKNGQEKIKDEIRNHIFRVEVGIQNFLTATIAQPYQRKWTKYGQ